MQSNNGHNGNGGGSQGDGGGNGDEGTENVIQLPTGKERDNARRVRMKVTMDYSGTQKGKSENAAQQPMINLPPFTKWLLLILISIHVVTVFMMNPVQQYQVISMFGFIPAYYSGSIPFSWSAVVGPFTYAFLHGGWGHLLINGVMMVAFGAGLERWMGWKRMAVFMLGCSLASVFVQWVIAPSSDNPVIGASGAISGMFAAAMIMLQQSGATGMAGRFGLWPFIAVWIGISVLFGMMGGPGGESIAWPAHIGGFLAGFVLIKPVLRLKI